jgi:hypothetical protein
MHDVFGKAWSGESFPPFWGLTFFLGVSATRPISDQCRIGCKELGMADIWGQQA